MNFGKSSVRLRSFHSHSQNIINWIILKSMGKQRLTGCDRLLKEPWRCSTIISFVTFAGFSMKRHTLGTSCVMMMALHHVSVEGDEACCACVFSSSSIAIFIFWQNYVICMYWIRLPQWINSLKRSKIFPTQNISAYDGPMPFRMSTYLS